MFPLVRMWYLFLFEILFWIWGYCRVEGFEVEEAGILVAYFGVGCCDGLFIVLGCISGIGREGCWYVVIVVIKEFVLWMVEATIFIMVKVVCFHIGKCVEKDLVMR